MKSGEGRGLRFTSSLNDPATLYADSADESVRRDQDLVCLRIPKLSEWLGAAFAIWYIQCRCGLDKKILLIAHCYTLQTDRKPPSVILSMAGDACSAMSPPTSSIVTVEARSTSSRGFRKKLICFGRLPSGDNAAFHTLRGILRKQTPASCE